jgi:hypothetical protein
MYQNRYFRHANVPSGNPAWYLEDPKFVIWVELSPKNFFSIVADGTFDKARTRMRCLLSEACMYKSKTEREKKVFPLLPLSPFGIRNRNL